MATHFPLIVIGAGAGGLVIAIGAAKAGRRVLLIEKGPYGGDCTNFGCIPSKSLIAAAHCAHQLKLSPSLGIKLRDNAFSAEGALERCREIIEEIRGHESPEALKKLGVDTLTGNAHFLDAHKIAVVLENGGGEEVSGDQIVIAAGSHPHIPQIRGIHTVPYLTNETIFDLQEVPKDLAIVGGGPIGCELAQAFSRLGARVTLIHHHARLLDKESPNTQEVIENTFCNENIKLLLKSEPIHVENTKKGITITVCDHTHSEENRITCDQLLIAAGRRPNIKGLNLEKAQVAYTQKGINVDRYGRTTQKHIWAVGDIVGKALFTHIAENQARAVLTSLLLPGFLKKKWDAKQAIPRVTYTDPEIAALGLSAKEAKNCYGTKKIAVYHVPLSEVDRAVTTGRTEGFVQIITKKWSGKILGATIVSPRAGEMLLEISTAMHSKLSIRKLATLIHPYPSYSQAIRKAADQWLINIILPLISKLTGKSQ